MDLLLHPSTHQQLQEVIKTSQGSYIFYGSAGTGRFTSWLWILRAWHGHEAFTSSCQSCIQIRAQTYPDLHIIAPDGESIGIAQIHTTLHALNMSRHNLQSPRLVLIDSADKLTLEAQNALLKVLEEPPDMTVIGLLSNSVQALIPTLRSRAKTVSFLPLKADQIEQYLLTQLKTNQKTAETVSKLADGRIGRAIQLLNNPDSLQAHMDTVKIVEELCSSNLFNNLKLVGQIGDAKVIPVALLIEALQKRYRVQLRRQLSENDYAGVLRTKNSLKASLRFQRHLKSNVSLKAALGALVLELA